MNEHEKKYVQGKIDEYELADLLGIKYEEIGAHIMSKGLYHKVTATGH